MVNHGISTGALFLIIGMIYDRRHTREIKDFQGIAKVLPIFTTVFMITTFSSIGLPGLNGFVGEFLILLGSFSSEHVSPVYAVLGTTGVIIAAVYMLWMFRRVMFGELDKDENRSLIDLNARELGLMIPLIALMFYLGFHATPVLKEISKSSDRIVEKVVNRTNSNFSQK
jgi:NADH-quinone oxidoreductase subunit M